MEQKLDLAFDWIALQNGNGYGLDFDWISHEKIAGFEMNSLDSEILECSLKFEAMNEHVADFEKLERIWMNFASHGEFLNG